MTRRECNIVMFAVVICSAVSTLFCCSLPKELSHWAFLMLVGFIPAALIAVVGARRLKEISRSTVVKAFVLAIPMAVAIVCDRMDCTYLSSTVATAYSAMQVVFVPLMLLIWSRKPTAQQALGSLIIIVGILVMRGTFWQPLETSWDYFNQLLNPCMGSLAISVYIVGTSFAAKTEDPIALTILEMFFCGMFGLAACLLTGDFVGQFAGMNENVLGHIYVIAFFGRVLATCMENIVQRFADPMDVAVAKSATPFIAVLLAAVLPNIFIMQVSITHMGIVGAFVIGVGAFIAQSEFDLTEKLREFFQAQVTIDE